MPTWVKKSVSGGDRKMAFHRVQFWPQHFDLYTSDLSAVKCHRFIYADDLVQKPLHSKSLKTPYSWFTHFVKLLPESAPKTKLDKNFDMCLTLTMLMRLMNWISPWMASAWSMNSNQCTLALRWMDAVIQSSPTRRLWFWFAYVKTCRHPCTKPAANLVSDNAVVISLSSFHKLNWLHCNHVAVHSYSKVPCHWTQVLT